MQACARKIEAEIRGGSNQEHNAETWCIGVKAERQGGDGLSEGDYCRDRAGGYACRRRCVEKGEWERRRRRTAHATAGDTRTMAFVTPASAAAS